MVNLFYKCKDRCFFFINDSDIFIQKMTMEGMHSVCLKPLSNAGRICILSSYSKKKLNKKSE